MLSCDIVGSYMINCIRLCYLLLIIMVFDKCLFYVCARILRLNKPKHQRRVIGPRQVDPTIVDSCGLELVDVAHQDAAQQL